MSPISAVSASEPSGSPSHHAAQGTGYSAVTRSAESRTWLTGFPGFASGVNQRHESSRENTGRLLAQVDRKCKTLSTMRNANRLNELRQAEAAKTAFSLSTCRDRGQRPWERPGRRADRGEASEKCGSQAEPGIE